MREFVKERLEELEGNFWTRLEDLVEEIEEMDFTKLSVIEANREYLSVTAEDVEDVEYIVHLAGTERTIVIEKVEELDV